MSSEVVNNESDDEWTDMDEEADISEAASGSSHHDTRKVSNELLSLEKTCLNCITKNFDIFNLAYNTTKSAELYRNLNFLQRKYSEYLIEQVSDEEGYLSGNYIEFLINEYITELDCGKLIKAPWSTVYKKIEEMGHVLEKVSFRNMFTLQNQWCNEYCDFVNQIVGKLKNVKELDIPYFANDETMKIISVHCRKVTLLCLDESHRISSEGLEKLFLGSNDGDKSSEPCVPSSLESVCLDKTRKITPGGVEELSSESVSSYVCGDKECVSGALPLQTISLQGKIIRGEVLTHLLDNIPTLEHVYSENFARAFIQHICNKSEKKQYNLKSLRLTNLVYYTTKEALTALVDVCPKLEKLELDIETKDELILLKKFSSMKELEIRHLDVEIIEVNDLLKSIGAGLRRLLMSRFSVSAEVLTKECRNLVLLSLDFTTFLENRITSNVTIRNNLTRLYLSQLDFSAPNSKESVNRILESCPHLEKISFTDCTFGGSDVGRCISSYCENNSSLLTFEVIRCDVESALLENVLLTCSALRLLHIENCKLIGEDEIEILENTLEWLQNSPEIEWKNDEQFDDEEENSFDVRYDGDFEVEWSAGSGVKVEYTGSDVEVDYTGSHTNPDSYYDPYNGVYDWESGWY